VTVADSNIFVCTFDEESCALHHVATSDELWTVVDGSLSSMKDNTLNQGIVNDTMCFNFNNIAKRVHYKTVERKVYFYVFASEFVRCLFIKLIDYS